MYVCLYMYVCMCMYVCVCVYVYAYMYVCMSVPQYMFWGGNVRGEMSGGNVLLKTGGGIVRGELSYTLQHYDFTSQNFVFPCWRPNNISILNIIYY